MKRALVIYNSKTGTTKKYGEELSNYLSKNNYSAKSVSINDFNKKDFSEADYVLLGTWTSGLMILLQHPQKVWIEFAKSLPEFDGKKVGLFTTYKLATGSLFTKMKKHININPDRILFELKSRDGSLSEADKKVLNQALN